MLCDNGFADNTLRDKVHPRRIYRERSEHYQSVKSKYYRVALSV